MIWTLIIGNLGASHSSYAFYCGVEKFLKTPGAEVRSQDLEVVHTGTHTQKNKTSGEVVAFDRFWVKYRHRRWQPKTASYVDVFTPKELSVDVDEKGRARGHVTYSAGHDNDEIPYQLKPDNRLRDLLEKTFGVDVVSAARRGADSAMSWVLRSKQLYENWKNWSKYTIRELNLSPGKTHHFVHEGIVDIAITLDAHGNFESLKVRPRVGVVKVHQGVLNPVVIDPLKLKGSLERIEQFWEHALGDFDEPERSMAGRAVDRVKRLSLHPNRVLRLIRQMGMDMPTFMLFQPYMLVYDLLVKRKMISTFPWYRWGGMGLWLAYLLFELFGYTPISVWFSDETDNMDEGWAKFFFGNEWVTDWYAVEAQRLFINRGVTVVWSGLMDKRWYDTFGKEAFIWFKKFQFSGFNQVFVSWGAPEDERGWEKYEIVAGAEDEIVAGAEEEPALRRIGYVWFNPSERHFKYMADFSRGKIDGVSDTYTLLSKVIFKMIRDWNCVRSADEFCGIQNVVMNAHGFPGGMGQIWKAGSIMSTNSAKVRRVSSGENENFDLSTESFKLDGAYFSTLLNPDPQLIMLTCQFAKEDVGDVAMKEVAQLFQIHQSERGRLVATTYDVYPIFSVLPLRLSENREKENRWSWDDIMLGYVRFGPYMTYRWAQYQSSGPEKDRIVVVGPDSEGGLDVRTQSQIESE